MYNIWICDSSPSGCLEEVDHADKILSHKSLPLSQERAGEIDMGKNVVLF